MIYQYSVARVDYIVHPALLIMLMDQSIMGTSMHHVLMLIQVSLSYQVRNQESIFCYLMFEIPNKKPFQTICSILSLRYLLQNFTTLNLITITFK